MNQVGFDSEKYIRLQSEHIRERINQFGGKLYLEFGGKLFDDYHASRVLPGFAPDSKIKMLLALTRSGGNRHRHQRRATSKRTSAAAIWASPTIRTSLRLIDVFRGIGLYVGSDRADAVCAVSLPQTCLKSVCRRSASRFTVNTAFPDYPADVRPGRQRRRLRPK